MAIVLVAIILDRFFRGTSDDAKDRSSSKGSGISFIRTLDKGRELGRKLEKKIDRKLNAKRSDQNSGGRKS